MKYFYGNRIIDSIKGSREIKQDENGARLAARRMKSFAINRVDSFFSPLLKPDWQGSLRLKEILFEIQAVTKHLMILEKKR